MLGFRAAFRPLTWVQLKTSSLTDIFFSSGQGRVGHQGRGSQPGINRAQGLEFRVQGLGYRVLSATHPGRCLSLEFLVEGVWGFRAWGD